MTFKNKILHVDNFYSCCWVNCLCYNTVRLCHHSLTRVLYVFCVLNEVMSVHYSFCYLVSDLTQSDLLMDVINSHSVFTMFARLGFKPSRYSQLLSSPLGLQVRCIWFPSLFVPKGVSSLQSNLLGSNGP